MHSMQYWGHTNIKKLFIVYLKLKFNWTLCILSGNPEGGFECSLEAGTIWVMR